jgi:hypothetical protein
VGRARNRGSKRLARRTRLIQIVSLAIAVLLGGWIFASKVGAQPTHGAPGGGAAGAAASGSAAPKAPGAEKKAKNKDGGVDAAAALAASAAAAQQAPDAAADAGWDPDAGPLDYAVVQSDEDFPKDISSEEKEMIGTGKVPIHREGVFKSPFAHPHFGGPANVKVGLVISEIREFSIQTGGYEADFFLSLTSDKDMPSGLDLTWSNGHEVTTKTLADTPTFKFYRVSGKFSSAMDLRKYPFDIQVLRFQMEDSKAGVDQLVFEPDKQRTSLDSTFRMESYSVASIGGRAYKHRYPTRFDRDDLYVSRYEFTLGIERFAQSAAFSVYVPALIIVIISLMGMWVPPDELEVRSNAGAPMLAAAVLFHYSLIQSLPATGYLTRADKLMLGVYISLLVNMASTWALLLFDEEATMKVFRVARAWVPPATVVVMILSIVM